MGSSPFERLCAKPSTRLRHFCAKWLSGLVAPTPRLTDYPRPNVAVDLALLTVLPARRPTPGRRWRSCVQERNDGAARARPSRPLPAREPVGRGRGRRPLPDQGRVRRPVGDEPRAARRLRRPRTRRPRAWTISLAYTLVLPRRGGRGTRSLRPRRSRPVTRRAAADCCSTTTRSSVRRPAGLREQYELTPDPGSPHRRRLHPGRTAGLARGGARANRCDGTPSTGGWRRRRSAPTTSAASAAGRVGYTGGGRSTRPCEVRRLRLPRAAG